MSKRNLGVRSLILTSLLAGFLSWIQIPSANAAQGLNIYFKNEAGLTDTIIRTEFTTGTCNSQVTNLDFTWSGSAPAGCNSDGFTGFADGHIIWPGTAGTQTPVTFYAAYDDGSFVTIDGTTVIESWIEGKSFYQTSSAITKTAGIAYPFKAYFHENGGAAVWRLSWSYYGQSIIAIPVSSFSNNTSAQAALSFSLSTSSSTYTGSAYTQALTFTPSGGSGTGAITYAISGGTATTCALSSSGATPTITATTSGTCLITATKAADVDYSAVSSSAMTFTFNKAVISALSLSLAGGVITAQKGRAIVITVAIDQVGKVSFFVDGKRIKNCFKLSASGSTRTCSWKPAVQKAVTLSAELVPTNSAYSNASGSLKVQVTRRTSTR